jgi:hypothetical protein
MSIPVINSYFVLGMEEEEENSKKINSLNR